ncbi:MAG: response regulator transcription factor [Bacteroidota bacterium]
MDLTRTVGIADAQLLARSGITHLLSNIQGIELLFETTSEAELLKQLSTAVPDILIIDYDQAPHFTSKTVNYLIQTFPSIQLLIITDNDDRGQILQLLRSGVPTFITKGCSEQEVDDAIRAAVRKEKFFCAKVLDYLLDGSGTKEEKPLSTLSRREIEIVSLIGRGLVAKEIAAELHLSTHTVYTHRKNILKKLDLSSSSELLVFALQNNLVNN